MSGQLKKNILATIIYYDGFEYPLTVFEIWKYLIRTDYYSDSNDLSQVTIFEVAKQLQEKNLSTYISNRNGFYFLKGRDCLIEKRIVRDKISTGKIKRLKKSLWWIKFVPFVRMIGLTGSLAMKNAQKKSDWDVLIVLKSGKIWTGRTLVTLMAHAIKKRRHGEKIADRICLNCFITDETLEMSTKNLFYANEYMFTYPLLGWETFKRFQLKNQWIRSMKPSYVLSEVCPQGIIEETGVSKAIRNMGEALFSVQWLENFLKKIEKRKIMKNPLTHQEGSMVYADDDALIFWPDPQYGSYIFERFKEKVSELSV